MGKYTEIILTLLTISTSFTTILTFIIARKKENKIDGEKSGTLAADLQYIKSILLDVRQETKTINALVENHSEKIARIDESVKQAHKRIDGIENKIKGVN